MSEPTREAVYWRRRLVATSGVVVALLVSGWAIGGFFGDDPEGDQAVPAGERMRPSRPPSTPPRHAAASRTTTTAAPATPGPTTPAPPASQSPAAVRQGTPGPCPDAVLAVAAEVGATDYRLGQRPEFRLVIANTGPVPCIRDVDRQFRELVVTTQDGVRVWSSQDCYSSRAPEQRTFGVGSRRTFPVAWSGRSSTPGCPGGRQPAGAGTYLLTGRFGPFVSAPVAFTLTRSG